MYCHVLPYRLFYVCGAIPYRYVLYMTLYNISCEISVSYVFFNVNNLYFIFNITVNFVLYIIQYYDTI